MLIALEGIDGSGKTTVGIEATIQLRKLGMNVKYIKFPSEWATRLLKSWSEYSDVVFVIFSNDHMGFLKMTEPDCTYIMDRSYISMFAYNVRDKDTSKWVNWDENLYKSHYLPYIIDKTFVFEVPYWTSAHRITDKQWDSGHNNRVFPRREFDSLVKNIRTEAHLWSKSVTFIDNYEPHNTFKQSVERVVDGIIKI